MNTDIRVALSFFDHRKTKRLIERWKCQDDPTGLRAAWGLMRLWAYAAEFRPSGDLSGMTPEDIAIEANVPLTECQRYVKDLQEIHWLDDMYLHDWHEHNPWAAGSEDRSDRSRFTRMAKTHSAIFKKLKKSGVNAISKEDYAALTRCQRPVNVALSPAPAPSPAPSPAPMALNNLDECFERFWNDVYPHRNGIKIGRQEAYAAFLRSVNENDLEDFMKAAANFRKVKERDSFGIMDPVRFIVKGRGKEKYHPWKEYVSIEVPIGGPDNGQVKSRFESPSERRERELRERHDRICGFSQ